MAYRFLDDVTHADIAFEATGADLEALFRAAAEATVGSMVSDLDSIADREKREIALRCTDTEQLLHEFLEKLIFYKDAEQLLLKVRGITITADALRLKAQLVGERIEPSRHELITDVKAVTFHRFKVERGAEHWKATVVLDV